MAGIRSLAKDTAVYGLSSIVGRFLNWLLVPLYTNLFAEAQYGIVNYIYSIVAVALILLTYGMETGFFRFANHEEGYPPRRVYSTTLISLITSSALAMGALLLFPEPVSRALGCASHSYYVWMMGLTVAVDAVTSIPFAWLRYEHRAMRFALLKMAGIGLNIGLNLWFLIACPWLDSKLPGSVSWCYSPSMGIGYIFLSNLLSTAATLMMLLPELRGFSWKFDGRLWQRMIRYSFPLLILGIAGIMNQSLGTILLPDLLPDYSTAMAQVGIYGANYKIAVVMVMFIQAFRFAYEPFIFARNTAEGGSRVVAYSEAMKYFVIFAMVIFLTVMYYLDILRYFISPRYFSGLRVVPVIMIAEFFLGVFYNLSVWYKVTDRTVWGTWFSLGGLVLTLALNIILVPHIGYMGCAWAALGCYSAMALASWVTGRTRYPIPYRTGRMAMYFAGAMILYLLGSLISTGSDALDMLLRTPLLAAYIIFAVRHEHLSIPSPRRLIRQLVTRGRA